MMFVMVSCVLCFVYRLVTISDYLLNVCSCLYNSFDKFHVCFHGRFYGPTEMI